MENQFLTNYTSTTFLQKIKSNLRTCKSFDFSVSFIKKAGLVLLYKDIEAAIERGCKGRIITSTYQNFTDIESLKCFYSLMGRCDNFECHLDYECFVDSKNYQTIGYHSKGYFFGFEDHRQMIIGSSNITRYALLKNIEWDVCVVDHYDSVVYEEAISEFEDKWNKTFLLDSDMIKKYANRLNYAIERWDMDYDLSRNNVKPNYMQKKALKELNRYRVMGIDKALTIASAGSGKTYLSAFDALNFNPEKLLYIVHEGSILKKSLDTFREVFGNSVTYGVYSGTSKELDTDFLFATNISMYKSLELFSKKEFDYIIIDECHHAVADTYKAILEYFEPEFLLGITATPERLDNQDVFELFDHNVPYELRLRDAIANDLVVPFKYYGIRDSLVDYGFNNANKTAERKMIAQMADEEHVEFIYKMIEKYRPHGKLKALAFCRNITHARSLCEAMGEHYHTAYLTGRNDVGERIRAYNDLQDETKELEILFTVDILNEGVDIPGVNMVLFLRPTDSSTIFIQQLGRGLRKYTNKEDVKVLDFIGNSYKRSVQIAFALGSLAENFVLEKRLMSSLVKDDFVALGLDQYGVEIHIDDLSKEEILKYIEEENFNALKYIKQDYYNFKKYLNAQFYPKHMDYLNNDCAPDLIKFMNIKMKNKKNFCYYNFLKGIDEENLPIFTKEQVEFISYLSSFLPLVREHEYMIVEYLLEGDRTYSEINMYLSEKIDNLKIEELDHALKYLDVVKKDGDRYGIVESLDEQFLEYVKDMIDYGLARYVVDYGEERGFKLWGNYQKEQVQRKLLKDPKSIQVGTYYYSDNDENYIVIFALLKKDLADDDKLNYKDKFLQANLFQWESMTNLPKSHLEKLKSSKYVHLFIRKMESENGLVLPYSYVGKGKIENPRKMIGGNGTYLFDIYMENELPEYLQYDFGLIK